VDGPTQTHYMELFIITVCSAPAWELTNCYDSLIPALTAFGQPSYPITIRSWQGEFTNNLDNFRSANPKIGPAEGLLCPQPLFVIKGAPLTTTLTDILTALGSDQLDTSQVQYGFIARGEGFPASSTCWIAPGGNPLFHTSGLLSCTSAASTTMPDHPDMARLRERYTIYRRALGLPPLVTAKGPTAGTVQIKGKATPHTRVVTTGDPTFAHIARQMPKYMMEMFTAHIDARVESQTQLALHGTQASITAIRTTQDTHGAALKALGTKQKTLESDLEDTTRTLFEAKKDVFDQLTTLTSLTKMQAEMETRVTEQAATLAKLTARLQTMGKRQATDMSEEADATPSTATRLTHE